MGILCFQLENIPDLTLNKYQSLADTGVEGVLKRHGSFLRQWHGICTESTTSIHLLYYFLPQDNIGTRLKVFLILQGNDSQLKLVEPLVSKSPLSDFFEFKKTVVPKLYFSSGATMMKKERIAELFNPVSYATNTVHYVPQWKTDESARLYDLFRFMQTASLAYMPQSPCAFRVDLYPASLVHETRGILSPVLKSLRGENDLQLLRETSSLKYDDYAKDICRECEDWMASIDSCPHFRANIYSFAESTFQAKILLNAAGAEAVCEGEFALAQLKPDEDGSFNLLSRLSEQAEDYCFYPNSAMLKSWSTTYCLSEITPFFRFPTLYDGEFIDIPKESSAAQVSDGLYLGMDLNGYPVNFPLKDLSRHAFFTGMPGSGKTNTMLHLVSQLKQHGIPFLALEPAKKEYRTLLGHSEMQEVHLFSPHLQSKFPLKINPMAFPTGARLSEHINALLEVFQGSFILEGPTHKFLSSAIQKSYTDLGWDIEDINSVDCQLPYPTLQNVYDNLSFEVEASSYDTEYKGNVRAFMQVRLGSLMDRDAGDLFNVRYSTIKPEEWIQKSAIVELEVLSEQAKNFFVLLVCHYILETLRINPKGGCDAYGKELPVRHVVFIEEAHNIIAPSTRQDSPDTVDPKVSATSYIIKMLAEVRALREAIVIADQLPTALASEVTKNTGLKLVHRLTAQDDREQIGTAISASPVQLERMASFTSGQAFIYHEKTMRPFEMHVAEWTPPSTEYDCSDDAQLYESIGSLPNSVCSVRVALECWREKYLIPLYEKIYTLQKEALNALSANASSLILSYSKQSETLLTECRSLQKKLRRLEELWLPDNYVCPDVQSAFKAMNTYIDSLIRTLNVIKG